MKSHPHQPLKWKPYYKSFHKSRKDIRNKAVEKVSGEVKFTSNKLGIIWNAVLPCDFNCSICCVNAWHIRPCDYPLYEKILVASGKQLSSQDQLKVVGQIAEMKGRKHLDISGGNAAFMLYNGKDVLKAIGDNIGRENVSISIPGSLITRADAEFIASVASTVEVSIDVPPNIFDPTRHPLLPKTAIRGLYMFRKYDVRKVSCTILKSGINIDRECLSKLAKFLVATNTVDEWEWLRYLPVGRASYALSYIPKPSELYTIIKSYEELRDKYSKQLEIKLQHSLLNMFRQFASHEEARCKAVKNETLGILPDGTVLCCPWLLNSEGRPLSPEFKLGKVPTETLSNIARRSRRIQKSDLLNQGDCEDCELTNGCDECLAASQSISRLFLPEVETKDVCSSFCFPTIISRLSRSDKPYCFGQTCVRVKQCYPRAYVNGKSPLFLSKNITEEPLEIMKNEVVK